MNRYVEREDQEHTDKYYALNKLVIDSKQGDKLAKLQLIEKLEPLIKSEIRGYANVDRKLDYDDFYQECTIAIIECIDEYDESKGVYFLGFLKSKIQYHLLNLHTRVKLDEKVSSLNYVEDVNEDIEKIELIVDESKDIEKYLLEKEISKELISCIKKLTVRERYVIVEYYFESKRLKTISDELNVSYRTVVNTKVSGINRLRKLLKKENYTSLKTYKED